MKIFFGGLLILLLALTGCAPNRARNNEDMALITGDYKTALAQYQAEAAQGDNAAEMKLGYMYTRGLGMPADPAEGLRWYEKAADDGNTNAVVYMGHYAMWPSNGQADYPQAIKWLKVCADQRNHYCELNLSIIYESGLGTPRDHDQAVQWLNMYIGDTNVAGAPIQYKYKGGDNIGGFMLAVQDAVYQTPKRLITVSQASTGVVIVGFTYKDGRALDVTVIKSSGDPAADAEAVDVMQRAYLPPLLASLQNMKSFEFVFNFLYAGKIKE